MNAMKEPLFDRVEPDEARIVEEFARDAPVKVGALAEALGLEVIRSPLKPLVSGLIRPSSKARAGFEILVNKYDIPERQRFTVAHEIGHYLLHRKEIGPGVVDSVLYRSTLGSRMETEANRIAASIVMPAGPVVRELKKLGDAEEPGVVEELAQYFRVSLPAMKVRLGVA